MTDVTNHQCCGNCKHYNEGVRICFAPLPFWAVGMADRVYAEALPEEGIACQAWVPTYKLTKETDR